MKAELIGNRNYKKGTSTIEIMISFALLTLSLGAVLLLSFGNQSVAIDSHTNNEALEKAKIVLEEARAKSRLDFHLVNPISPSVEDIYTKELKVSMDLGDFFTKKVTSEVVWKTDGGRDQKISLSTLITNPEGLNGGTTCNSVLEGDWSNPQVLGDADVGQNNGGTDVDVFGGKAYVTANASAVNKHDFYIIDVLDPNINNRPLSKVL